MLLYCNYCRKTSTDWRGDDWFLVERGNDKPYMFCCSVHVKYFAEMVHKDGKTQEGTGVLSG